MVELLVVFAFGTGAIGLPLVGGVVTGLIRSGRTQKLLGLSIKRAGLRGGALIGVGSTSLYAALEAEPPKRRREVSSLGLEDSVRRQRHGKGTPIFTEEGLTLTLEELDAELSRRRQGEDPVRLWYDQPFTQMEEARHTMHNIMFAASFVGILAGFAIPLATIGHAGGVGLGALVRGAWRRTK